MEEKKSLLVISLAVLLLAVPFVTASGAAEDSASGSVFSFGTDAKSLSMGGSFVAVADNYSASYWNPAGLTQFSGVQLGGMNLQPHGVNGLNFSYGGGAVTFQNFAFGANYGQLSAGISGEYGYGDEDSYSETLIGGSFAYGIDFANFGANVKSYQFGEDSGFGFDLGTLMTFNGISLGVAATDVGGVSLGENTNLESSYRLGVATELLDRATASAEVDLRGDDRLIKAGFEILPIEQFALRGGVQVPSGEDRGPAFTLGGGIDLAGLTVDIAWMQNNTQFSNYDGAGDTLVLSAGFQFGAFGESA